MDQSDGGGSTTNNDNCMKCKKECKDGEPAMTCDECDRWYHIECEGINKLIYKYYNDKNMADLRFYWRCSACENDLKGKRIYKKNIEEISSKLEALKEDIDGLKKTQKNNDVKFKEDFIIFV